jgi:small subunit ribosomal protein S9
MIKPKETTIKKIEKTKEGGKGQGKEKTKKTKEEKAKYYEATGRRKTSTAQVRLFTSFSSDSQKDIASENIIVNEKFYKDYFPIISLQKRIEAPIEKLNSLGKFSITIKVKGGGASSQAGACSHGMARALVLLNPLFRKQLKTNGFLTRDSRMRERKKFGLKRARKAPQWSKR